MTNKKAKIGRAIVKHRNLSVVLEKTGISDYIELQEALGPGVIQFADVEDDNTEIFLSDQFLEELELRHYRSVDVWITRILSVIAIVVSIIALFRPC